MIRNHSFSILFLLISVAVPVMSAEIHVPAQYPTIQAAIQAASSGDTISVEAGRYRETLSIPKSIILKGAGSGLTTVYFPAGQSPLVSIDAASVELRGLEFNGGDYDPNFDYYAGVSSIGLSAKNTSLRLVDVFINQFANKHVLVSGGSLDARDVAFNTRHINFQCDFGFELNGCDAVIDNLRQEEGKIDHTVTINEDSSLGPADVTVKHSVIVATDSPYGDCIRTRQDVKLTVYDCALYRNPGSGLNDPNTGVNLTAYNTDATITQNHFSGMPVGIAFSGSYPDSNRMLVEQNTFSDCTESGVLIQDSGYEGIDLGQGLLGSIGQNTFSNPAGFDVKLNDTSADIHAAFNSWTYQTIATGIWDGNDDPSLGYVLYKWKPPRPLIRATTRVPIIPELMWDPIGGGTIYKVQVSTRRDFKTTVFQSKVRTNYVRLAKSLRQGTQYFWRVQSSSPWGTSEWSDVGEFQVDSIKLSPGPVLTRPAVGAVLNSVAPMVVWDAVRDALSYHLQVSLRSDFKSLLLDNTEVFEPRDVLKPLSGKSTYYWRVRAIAPSGLTDWSRTFSFAINVESPRSKKDSPTP